MIRQAILCDVCGAEKKQTNHWFVAYEQGGELRLSGWSARKRLHPGTKHLCGQVCLHKLVDDFMARALAVPASQSIQSEAGAEAGGLAAKTDASLTSSAAYEEFKSEEFESSARLIEVPMLPPPAESSVVPVEAVAGLQEAACQQRPIPVDELPRTDSTEWRAGAWERERERERKLRTVEPRVGGLGRRGSWRVG